MIRCVFVTASGLVQQVTNRVRAEHPIYEGCCKSSNGACFRCFAASYVAQRLQAIELVP
jgi:hypothetical protein